MNRHSRHPEKTAFPYISGAIRRVRDAARYELQVRTGLVPDDVSVV